MSVTYNPVSDKWEVRLQRNGARRRYGSYATQTIAKAKEMSILYEEDLWDFEEPEQHALWFNPIKWLKKKNKV